MKKNILSSAAIAAFVILSLTGIGEAGPGKQGDSPQLKNPKQVTLQNRHLNPRLACQLSGGKWVAIVVLGKYGQPAGTRWVCKR